MRRWNWIDNTSLTSFWMSIVQAPCLRMRTRGSASWRRGLRSSRRLAPSIDGTMRRRAVATHRGDSALAQARAAYAKAVRWALRASSFPRVRCAESVIGFAVGIVKQNDEPCGEDVSSQIRSPSFPTARAHNARPTLEPLRTASWSRECRPRSRKRLPSSIGRCRTCQPPWISRTESRRCSACLDHAPMAWVRGTRHRRESRAPRLSLRRSRSRDLRDHCIRRRRRVLSPLDV